MAAELRQAVAKVRDKPLFNRYMAQLEDPKLTAC